ncbi:MAG TPA: electron transport complex subunit RsxC [Christensenellaceae bacterium]|nr:electron transport complex subunit RsxC [Christensenellaceae bacterium]
MSLFTFRGGVHPLKERGAGKDATCSKAIREFVPEVVYIPLDTHIGSASTPCVKKGDTVLMGQKIADAVGGIGISVHASVSGTVKEVGNMQMLRSMPSPYIAIENDGNDTWVELKPMQNYENASKEEIISAIKEAGICGMGGASFPTHAKLNLPEGKTVDTVLVNGAECETFLTADDRLMVEEPEGIVKGLLIAMRAVDAKKGIICIEDNKPKAIEAIKKAVSGVQNMEVAVLKTKYPQGGEKQLIDAVLKRQVPSGGLPMDVHAVVINVGTAKAISDAVLEGKPLVSRVTTVTGAVKEPDNLLVRVGTRVIDAVNACGGYAETPGKILFGGSMTGNAIPNDEVPITKANNGIVVLNEKEAELPEEFACIRCSRCIDVCPIGLAPYELKVRLSKGDLDGAQEKNLEDCILCGACSYICPARRVLTPAFKEGKDMLAMRRKKA